MSTNGMFLKRSTSARHPGRTNTAFRIAARKDMGCRFYLPASYCSPEANQMKQLIFAILLLVTYVTSGCATHSGQLPDFNLKGAEAEREIGKYTMSESAWDGGGLIVLGNTRERYTMESFRPVIESVSPGAGAILRKSGYWRIAASVLFGGAIYALIRGPDEVGQGVFWGLLGGNILANSRADNLKAEAGAQFNRDLREKFNPKVSWMWSFD